MHYYYYLRIDIVEFSKIFNIYLLPANDLIKNIGENVYKVWINESILVVSKRTINDKIMY